MNVKRVLVIVLLVLGLAQLACSDVPNCDGTDGGHLVGLCQGH